MLGFKSSRDKDRYYLLPGMGGKATRQKNRRFLAWSIVVAVLVSFVMLVLFEWLNRLQVD